MRLVVVTNEPPYPPNSGGRVDQWLRLRLMHDRGIRMMLVTWTRADAAEISARELDAMKEIFERIEIFPISRSLISVLRRALALPRWPPHVSTRVPPPNEGERLFSAVDLFVPDAVLLDAVYGGVVAKRLAERARAPLIYRSHNVEHLYMRRQAREAATLARKITCTLASVGLNRFETKIQQQSALTFDISEDDRLFWRDRGMPEGKWLPPLVGAGRTTRTACLPKPWDVVYLGNLNTPNNVRGVTWFVEQVLPRLKWGKPLSVRLAGSKPNSEIMSLMKRAPDVDWCIDPPNAGEIWASGRVLINPVFAGSGVNVKSVEMLFEDAHLVTTPVGVGGLPKDVQSEFAVVETPDAFAKAVAQGLAHTYELTPARMAARTHFGSDAADRMVADIHQAVKRAR